jgi:hypothetical protein
MVRGSNAGRVQISRILPDRSWGPPKLLCSEYQVIPGGEMARRGFNHPPPSSTEVKERVELYLCFPTVPSWQVIGWNVSFTCLYLVKRLLERSVLWIRGLSDFIATRSGTGEASSVVSVKNVQNYYWLQWMNNYVSGRTQKLEKAVGYS